MIDFDSVVNARAVGRLPGWQWQELREKVWGRDKGVCQMCRVKIGSDVSWVCDHIVPVKLGGRNLLKNLQVLCESCNKIKTADDLDKIAKVKIARKYSR